MDLLTPDLRATLRANADAMRRAQMAGATKPDPTPLVKLFSPVSAATWLATELDPDGDTLFGLADLGFGSPELGSFSLAEIAAVRLPFGLRIERDLGFASLVPVSVWADMARAAGSIIHAARRMRDLESRLRAALDYLPTNPLPSPDPDKGSEGG